MPWEKQFDPAQTLQIAQEVFWAHGYESTGLAKLLCEMGIQKGSFYATFGSKEEVYVAALTQYLEARFASFEQLSETGSPLAALRTHIQQVGVNALRDDSMKGCMMVNAAVELAPKLDSVRALVREGVERHVGWLRTLIDCAKSADELPATLESLPTARAIYAMIVGLGALARGGVPRAMLKAITQQTLKLVSPSD